MDVVILTMIFSDYRLRNKILSDRYNSIIFKKGKYRELYLVGGYVRDILRGMISFDRDYVVSGDISSFVNEIRDITGGSIVRFKKEDMIRIAHRDGLTIDFSRPTGTIEEDLSRRDFTINAIAWSPDKGLIDLYNGLNDIKEKKIRSISKKNLISDPLRLLRTYRFAAELNGSIEKGTREAIKILHNNIEKVSSERITLELFNLLNSKHSSRYLKMALSDGILTSILLIPYTILNRNIKAISILEKALRNRLPAKIKVLLNKIYSQNITYKGLLCMELLLQNGFSTATLKPNIAISNSIRKRLKLYQKGIKELRKTKGKLKLKDNLFSIFHSSKEAAIDILIISERLDLLKDYSRFKKIWKCSYLSSNEIIQITNITNSPRLGEIILELKKAQFEGRVRSKAQAVKLTKGLLTATF
jgi:tRNA nucleotidyltransferase (CCA-adding enzyme)